MLNQSVIKSAISKNELVAFFKQIGLKKEMCVEVHASLSSFGFVIGGAQTVIDALIETVGYEGTIACVINYDSFSEPSRWQYPPISIDLEQKVRDNMPVLNREASDNNTGSIVENLRRRPGSLCSLSPTCSYVAWGKYARLICTRQPLNFALGENSPTSHLYDLDAYVLLLGVDYDKCTLMHLAEYRSQFRPIIIEGAKVEIDNKPVYKKYLELDIDSEIFNEVGAFLERDNKVNKLKINDSICRLFSGRIAVDYACKYMREKK